MVKVLEGILSVLVRALEGFPQRRGQRELENGV
jgi:hypothetical protein